MNIPKLKLSNVQWLISEVTFSLDESGTKAELTIMPPQGFLPKPLILFPVKIDVVKTSK